MVNLVRVVIDYLISDPLTLLLFCILYPVFSILTRNHNYMFLKFAWRYFNAKKSTNAINIIAWVSMVAIVFITASFIVVLSVFNGFEGLVKSLYSSFYADLRISPTQGKILTITPEQIKNLSLSVASKVIHL